MDKRSGSHARRLARAVLKLVALGFLVGWVVVVSGQHARQAEYEAYAGRALGGHVLVNRSGLSLLRCSAQYAAHARCASFNYGRGSHAACQLNNATKDEFPDDWRLDEAFDYFETTFSSQTVYTRPTTVAPAMNITEVRNWTLVFQGFAGSQSNLHALWTDNGTWSGAFLPGGNWRNESLIADWREGDLNVTHVKLSVWDSSGVQAELVFDGAGSDLKSWFSQERLLSSPWDDLKTETKKNSSLEYFSIDGDMSLERHFLIANQSHQCNASAGWLVVVDAWVLYCEWAAPVADEEYPIILYSNASLSANWEHVLANDTDGTVGRAEYLTVHVDTV